MKECTGRRHGADYKILFILALLSLSCLVADAQSDRPRGFDEPSGIQTFSVDVLHTFTNSPDGDEPLGLVQDSSGNMYGLTYQGGLGVGAVFQLTPDGSGGWNYSIIYDLTGGIDGYLGNSLSIDGQGNLYGTAVCANGLCNGSVFELSRGTDGAWFLSNAYDFTGNSDGKYPQSAVVDSAGNVYGVTLSSGAGGFGTVFELQLVDNQWIENTLFAFPASGLDGGGSPVAGLIIDSTGDLYGASDGVVFRLHNAGAKGWVETILHNFVGGANDGSDPTGSLMFDKADNMYGTATLGFSATGPGNGGVYKITKSGKITWLYKFTGGEDGLEPANGVVFDKSGNLYGTAAAAPSSSCYQGSGCGLVFELMPPAGEGSGPWTEGVLYTFTNGKDGGGSVLPPLFDTAGNMYGVSYTGGIAYGSYGFGTVFELKPNPVPTATTITKNSPNPSTAGKVVTVTLNVAQTVKGNSVPTGTVAVNASTGESCIAALPPNGKTSCNMLFVTGGTRTLTATYSGDAGNESSVSPGVTQTVMNITETTITSNKPNPAMVGQAVGVDFSVDATNGATGKAKPTGSVTVNASTGESCTGTISAATGKGQCQLRFNSSGSRTLVATYAGDANNQGSVSTASAETVE